MHVSTWYFQTDFACSFYPIANHSSPDYNCYLSLFNIVRSMLLIKSLSCYWAKSEAYFNWWKYTDNKLLRIEYAYHFKYRNIQHFFSSAPQIINSKQAAGYSRGSPLLSLWFSCLWNYKFLGSFADTVTIRIKSTLVESFIYMNTWRSQNIQFLQNYVCYFSSSKSLTIFELKMNLILFFAQFISIDQFELQKRK